MYIGEESGKKVDDGRAKAIITTFDYTIEYLPSNYGTLFWFTWTGGGSHLATSKRGADAKRRYLRECGYRRVIPSR